MSFLDNFANTVTDFIEDAEDALTTFIEDAEDAFTDFVEDTEDVLTDFLESAGEAAKATRDVAGSDLNSTAAPRRLLQQYRHETDVLCVPKNVCSWWKSGHAADITARTGFDPKRSPARLTGCKMPTIPPDRSSPIRYPASGPRS
jgi:ABC-type transporter Mla subunit MlaD